MARHSLAKQVHAGRWTLGSEINDLLRMSRMGRMLNELWEAAIPTDLIQ